jgi:outer membrane biogenesis lipoprotein LolB
MVANTIIVRWLILYKRAFLMILCFSFILLTACSNETSSSRPPDIREEIYNEANQTLESISDKVVNGKINNDDLEHVYNFSNKFSDLNDVELKVMNSLLALYNLGSMVTELKQSDNQDEWDKRISKFNKEIKVLKKLLGR